MSEQNEAKFVFDVASWKDGPAHYWQAGVWEKNGKLLAQADARDTEEEARQDLAALRETYTEDPTP